jgi:hypothetical protein
MAMDPADYDGFLKAVLHRLPPEGRRLLHRTSAAWLSQPTVQDWFEHQKRQADRLIREAEGEFGSESPLSFSLEGPPPAPWVDDEGHPTKRLFDELGKYFKGPAWSDPRARETVARVVMLDGRNSYLIANHIPLTPNKESGGSISTGGEASSGGLAADYSNSTAPKGGARSSARSRDENKIKKKRKRTASGYEVMEAQNIEEAVLTYTAAQRLMEAMDVLEKTSSSRFFNGPDITKGFTKN